MSTITMKQVMKSPVETVNVNEKFSIVWDLFKLKGIRHLPVVDDKEILVGVITQRDQ